MNIPLKYWEAGAGELLTALETSHSGLTDEEAENRGSVFGPNLVKKKKDASKLTLFLAQFKSPIVLLLIFAVILSAVAGDAIDSSIIILIIVLSAFLSFMQERSAKASVEKLLRTVKTRVDAVRGGEKKEVLTEDLVPGDIIHLRAGTMVPADSVLLEAKDFFVKEALLTGETFPVEKGQGMRAEGVTLVHSKNCVFLGTNVVSGSALALVVRTGASTEAGRIAERLAARPPETDFEHGIRRFGYFLIEVTMVLVLIVFAINVYFRHPAIESIMFSLALAVGLTPQLLPAIISVNLARGSLNMSREGVIVKRLASIENFGTMDILCTDKTGTLTEGVVRLHDHLGCELTGQCDGVRDERVLFFAYMNAFFQTGLKNPIDDAIVDFRTHDVSAYEKVDEIPYDFERKRLSVIVRKAGEEGVTLISKGALKNLLKACAFVESEGRALEVGPYLEGLEKLYEDWSGMGYRVLGLARKEFSVDWARAYAKADETEMTFMGLLLFFDPPKKDVKKVISDLKALGIDVKIITGDNSVIARFVAGSVDFPVKGLVTGDELAEMSEGAILNAAASANIFAEVDPVQKEMLILALKKLGYVVGFLGDGINDAGAIHAADVGISVEGAVDVAKDAADIVLLEKGLETLRDGVMEGRRTFANTMKYVFMATSANFGNMFSVAGASLFLSFLPMLPKQILLMNLMTDFPEMTIAADEVDPELVRKPRKWDIKFIKRFMIFFGVISSVFDFVTFGVLLFVLRAHPTLFRTGWFMESVISASFAVLMLRTRKPFYRSRPGKYLLITTLLIAILTVLLPYLPYSELLGFQPVPVGFLAAVALIIAAYIVLIEAGKKVFYRSINNSAA